MTTPKKTNEAHKQCHGCGIRKDAQTQELYPYPEDGIVTDEPIDPFFNLDVEPIGALWIGPSQALPTQEAGPRWKDATVCHDCFHKLEPDMWIHERCWRSIDPVVGFDDLPDLKNRNA